MIPCYDVMNRLMKVQLECATWKCNLPSDNNSDCGQRGTSNRNSWRSNKNSSPFKQPESWKVTLNTPYFGHPSGSWILRGCRFKNFVAPVPSRLSFHCSFAADDATAVIAIVVFCGCIWVCWICWVFWALIFLLLTVVGINMRRSVSGFVLLKCTKNELKPAKKERKIAT